MMDAIELPDYARHAALQSLLAPTATLCDLEALDLLYLAWPRDTRDSTDESLLTVAQNLALNFGQPDRLPMSCSKAWRMLDPARFSSEMAAQLRTISHFVKDWGKTRTEFLILDYGEIELIEWLFEALDIGVYGDVLADVMNFKALSLRRAGLLRRIPPRVERQFAPLVTSGRADLAVAELSKVKIFLDRLVTADGFAPITDAARNAGARIQSDISVLLKAADSASVSLDS